MMAAERFMLSRSRCLSLWQQACVLDDALGLDPVLPEEPRELPGRVEDGLKPARDQVLVAEGRLVRDTPELSIPIALRSSRKEVPAALLRPRARSARFQPIAVVGEAEQPLDAVITRRARLRDAPLVRSAGRKLPMLRPAWLIIVVDLQYFRGVLDRHFVRPAEIGEDVVARPVPARPPFDRIA